MWNDLNLVPTDRVLLLSAPAPEDVTSLAQLVDQGLAVVFCEPDQLSGLRKACLHFDNVMFLAATPEEIPWRDEFFTVVVAIGEVPPDTREAKRVLVSGGRALIFTDHWASLPL